MTKDKTKETSGNGPMDDIKIGVDGLLGALGATIAEITTRLEQGQASDVRKSFEVDTGNGPVRAEAGIRVRFADSGRSDQATKPRPVNPDRREAQTDTGRPDTRMSGSVRPLDVEIIDEDGTWRLVADMPGVEEHEVSLSKDAGHLVIETTGARTYRATTVLPSGIEPDELECSLRNGILELSHAPNSTSDGASS